MSTVHAGANQTISMKLTSYGFNDNSPSSTDIAYPKSAGYPTIHDSATEGSGTYDDPITFATDPTELVPGTMIYVPHLRKYFIMEDYCGECETDWKHDQRYHVDVWMGPSSSSSQQALNDCESYITRDSASVIVHPDRNLPVDTTPLFLHDQCTAQVYEEGQKEE